MLKTIWFLPCTMGGCNEDYGIDQIASYSAVSNKRAVWNNRAGWEKCNLSIIMQTGIIVQAAKSVNLCDPIQQTFMFMQGLLV